MASGMTAAEASSRVLDSECSGPRPTSSHTSRPTGLSLNAPLESGTLEDGFDRARPWTKYPIGVSRYAAFIAAADDNENTIHRRFDRLYARNLLSLESELAALEAEQDRLDQEAQCNPKLKAAAKNWEELIQLAKGPGPSDLTKQGAQYRVDHSLRIRDTLETYYRALKAQSDVLSLDRPRKRALKHSRDVFLGFDHSHGSHPDSNLLVGSMRDHLADENDLCVLAKVREPDRLTRVLESSTRLLEDWGYLFRKKTTTGQPTTFIDYNKVQLFVTTACSLAEAGFLIGAMVGLFYVTSVRVQLIVVSVLTTAFACTFGLLTNARRQDVFAATAGYAAILVVFASGKLNNANSLTNTSQTKNPNAPVSTVTSPLRVTATTSLFSRSLSEQVIAGDMSQLHVNSFTVGSFSSGLVFLAICTTFVMCLRLRRSD